MAEEATQEALLQQNADQAAQWGTAAFCVESAEGAVAAKIFSYSKKQETC